MAKIKEKDLERLPLKEIKEFNITDLYYTIT